MLNSRHRVGTVSETTDQVADIEVAQAALRDSIEQTKQLAEKAEFLLLNISRRWKQTSLQREALTDQASQGWEGARPGDPCLDARAC